MYFLIFLFSAFFVLTAFFSNFSAPSLMPPIVVYVLFELLLVWRNFILFLLLFFLTGLFVSLFSIHKRKYSFSRKYFFSLYHMVIAGIIGLGVGYFVLLIIAVVELNILSIILRVNPQFAGVITDPKKIVMTLERYNTAPDIITSDPDQFKEVVAVAKIATGKNTFYAEHVLSIIPKFLVLPVGTSPSSLVLVDDTLIFTRIEQSDIQTVSPALGYLFVKEYFPGRNIKKNVIVGMIDRPTYQVYREQSSDLRIASIDTKMQIFQTNILSLSAAIQEDKKKIDDATVAAKEYLSRIETTYQECTKEGSIKNGIFYPTYPEAYCTAVRNRSLKEGEKINKEMENLKLRLESDQKQLSIYLYYDNYFKTQKEIIKAQKRNLPYELGIFEPENVIRIPLDTTSSRAIADYLEILIHEYLHYASYISSDKQLTSLFFEEGLTEYFARRIIANSLEIETNVGYPVYAKIIGGMTQMIPESEFAEIYFTKDQASLEAAIDRVYGEKFYAKNQVVFDTIQYTSSATQTLQLANIIMGNIKATPLKLHDLKSSKSSF